ncbi:MAG TPA: hypothetical protein VFI14_11630 [Chryseosolibacter sp.]|jgi:hypothetical protein|nr:hypothetical protein [Chryseosolibacter sp.]
MSARNRLYVFGLLFLAVGIYQLVRNDTQEFIMYALAATAFAVNGLSLEPRFASWKKGLSIAGWLLIAATGLLFLYMLQFS